MTRAEHMQWCKDRAMKYISRGDIQQGVTSMMSDLMKHPETENHVGIGLAMGFMMIGKLNSQTEAEKFINGFN